jgi:ABC-2 type transport system permease protein
MTAVAEPRSRAERSVPRAGWMVVGRKEFGDHILSSRFIVLIIVLGIAAAIPLYFLAGEIRDAAQNLEEFPALFLALFWTAPSSVEQIQLPAVVGFISIVGPLLGLAFSFDAINGERAEGTLPRLLSQPIHRDDVINGKFLAGMAVIGMTLLIVILGISAFGFIRLGIVPDAFELLRAAVWVLVTFAYVAFWLAFGLLLSVVVRRAATSALIGFGVWLLLTFFGRLIVGLAAGLIAPLSATGEDLARNIAFQANLYRLLPDTLYREASLILLNPQSAAAASVQTPATVAGYEQAQQQISSLLSLDQSLLLVWPQVIALVALTVGVFALAYIQFMRQEVRA